MESHPKNEVTEEIKSERAQLVEQLDDWLEIPMLVLSVIWLVLLVVEMTRGISPFLEAVSNVIWIIFGIDYAIKFLLAPEKSEYIKKSWVALLALALPALRIFRAFRAFRLLRAARTARGLRLVRLLTSLNRGMRSLGGAFSRRGVGYVMMLSLLVLFGGAAGMHSFEREIEGGFASYADALWWTAMLLTSIGTEYFPQTAEGRLLCLILAVYGFAVFGYMTATLATFFIQRDAETAPERGEPSIADLQDDLRKMTLDLKRILADRETENGTI
jgi:voltage-gated potassium channel